MLVPEIILYNSIIGFMKVIRDDWNDQTDKTQSLLYSLFENDDNNAKLEFETYEWIKQAESMFVRDVEDIRQLTVNIGYNPERVQIPTIHILMPQESKGGFDSLGKDEKQSYDTVNEILTTEKSQTFRSVYHLMITSDNSSEVMLVYYFLRTIFLMYHEQFELLGLLNMQFTGQDINIDQSLTPPHIFHRNVSLQFDYESTVKIKLSQKAIKHINFLFCNKLSKINNAAIAISSTNIHDDLTNYNV